MSKLYKRNDSPYYYYEHGTPPNRIRRSTQTGNLRLAKIVKDKWDEDRILKNLGLKFTQMSTQEVRMEFLKAMEGKKSYSWMKKLTYITQIFADMFEKPFCDVSMKDCELYISTRTNTVSPTTVYNDSVALSYWFSWGVKRKLIATNPMTGVALPKSHPVRKRVALTPDEIKHAISNAYYKDAIYWSVLYYTGLRAMDGATITKDMIVTGSDGLPVLKLDQGKTKNPAVIPLHTDLIGKDITMLFPKQSQSRASKDRLQKIIPHADLHTLRHSFASRLSDIGASTLEVKCLLGHSTTDVTAEYVHSSLTRFRGLINEL